ncbi:MAG: aminopeptidase [Bacteroidota bacterium]
MPKKILFGIFAILLSFILFHYELINYGLKQLTGQISIVTSTVPTSVLLEDPTFPDSLRQKIVLVNKVRKFAVEELGLRKTENYTTFYDQEGEVSLWNLSASEPFELKPYLWSFPVLGSFPYKGFFDLEQARHEEEQLKAEGFDTRIRAVGGWSTLGWTKDPILSNMLSRTDGALAELIIHELTHTTLFVEDDIAFNENLATFIGEKGAVIFLDTEFPGGEEKDIYLKAERDSRTFRQHMLRSATFLDSIYSHFNEKMSLEKKIQNKRDAIAQVTSTLDTLSFYNDRYYRLFEKTSPNNAFFMSYVRYYSKKDSLEDLFNLQYEGNLRLFVEGMKDEHGK